MKRPTGSGGASSRSSARSSTDCLTHCEPPGYPRFLLEPYSHEFINLPHESYLINDFGPSIRRVYIGQEHKNVFGTHSWYGDTIGFWDADKLVTNTTYSFAR